MSTSPLQPVGRPQSLADLAYEQLKAGILAGDFRLGHRFSVVNVAEQLSISRSPVRAAVERLSAEGLLTIDAGGIEIVGYDREDLLETLAVRTPLEILAAQLAASRAGELEREHLVETQQRFVHAIAQEDPLQSYEFDLGFHHEIWRIAGNAVLEQELHRLHVRGIVASQTISWSPLPVDSVPEHDRIAEAIIAGDAALAGRLAADHLEHITAKVRTGSSKPNL